MQCKIYIITLKNWSRDSFNGVFHPYFPCFSLLWFLTEIHVDVSEVIVRQHHYRLSVLVQNWFPTLKHAVRIVGGRRRSSTMLLTACFSHDVCCSTYRYTLDTCKQGKTKCKSQQCHLPVCFISLFLPSSSRRRGIPLPANTVEEMTQIIILEKPATLTTFLGKFAEYMHVIAWVGGVSLLMIPFHFHGWGFPCWVGYKGQGSQSGAIEWVRPHFSHILGLFFQLGESCPVVPVCCAVKLHNIWCLRCSLEGTVCPKINRMTIQNDML